MGFWLWTSVALAFRPATSPWPPESMPLPISVPQSSCPLGGDACLRAAQQAADSWAEVPCLGLVADVTGSDQPGDIDNGVNELLFDDELYVVYAYNFLNPSAQVLTYILDNGSEIDFHTVDGLPYATHDDVLAGECDEQIDLLGFSTWALGRMFRLREPGDLSPRLTREFWTPWYACDPERAILDPVSPLAFDFEPGIEIRCDPFGLTEGVVIPRVPLEVSCWVVPGIGVDAMFQPYDDIEWSWGDGTVTRGLEASHTYTEGGVHQIVATGFLDGEDCSTVRGQVDVAITLCPPVEADLTVDEPRGLTIHVRNWAPHGPPGCTVEAAWQVFEGPDVSGPVLIESTSWSPFLTLPAPGMYTAQVTLSGRDGATDTDQITFEVRRECDCSSAPVGALWLALGPLALIRRRTGRVSRRG